MTTTAHIILGYSATHGVVAFAEGPTYRWAETALKAAGFARLPDSDPYALPLHEPGAVRAALTELTHLARRHRASITALDRPYLGDVADQIVHKMPGAWTVQVDVYARLIWQTDLLDWLWDKGELASTLDSQRLRYGAILTNGTTKLLLADRPDRPGQYLAGAFLPEGFDRSLTGTPYAPNSIVLPSSPTLAAHAITTSLLPHYDHAAHRLRTDQIAAALAMGQKALDEWDAVSDSLADEQGFPLDDDAYGLRAQQRDAEVWEQFQVFLDHGADLLDTTAAHLNERPENCPTGHDASRQLTTLRGVLERGHHALADWRGEVARIGATADLRPEESQARAVAERNADAWDVMVTWLEQGPDLIPLARSVPAPPAAHRLAAPDSAHVPSPVISARPQQPRTTGDSRGR